MSFLFSDFERKKFANVVETVFILSRRKFRRIFGKVLRFPFFGLSVNFFWGFTENVSSRLSKLVLCVQMIFMGQKSPSDKQTLYFLSLLDFEQNGFVYSWKNSDITVKIAFHMFRETFRRFLRRKFVLFLSLVLDRKVFELSSKEPPKPLKDSLKWLSVFPD